MKRERIKAGCYSLKRKPNTFELAVLCRGNGDGKIKITGGKRKILVAMLWQTRWKSVKEGDSKEEESSR